MSLLLASGCERREPSPAVASPATTDSSAAPAPVPVPVPGPAPAPAPAARAPEPTTDEAPALATDSKAWEGRGGWRATFAASPEPAAFPTGAFRAATRMCADEMRPPPASPLDVTLALVTQGGHVGSVRVAAPDGGASVPPSFVACLERLYAKITVAKSPERFAASVQLSRATD